MDTNLVIPVSHRDKDASTVFCRCGRAVVNSVLTVRRNEGAYAMTPENQNCGNCMYVRWGHNGAKRCGRHAPIAVTGNDGYIDAQFPSVPCPPWCGDWVDGWKADDATALDLMSSDTTEDK